MTGNEPPGPNFLSTFNLLGKHSEVLVWQQLKLQSSSSWHHAKCMLSKYCVSCPTFLSVVCICKQIHQCTVHIIKLWVKLCIQYKSITSHSSFAYTTFTTLGTIIWNVDELCHPHSLLIPIGLGSPLSRMAWAARFSAPLHQHGDIQTLIDS